MRGSSAVVLNSVIYNIGGGGSSHSVWWCSLLSNDPPKWKSMDLENYSFKGYRWREALVVGNKIVYFGSNNQNATFMLEEEEEGTLRVTRKDDGFDLNRSINTASRVFKKEIYAFKTGKYDEVHRYNVETGKWSLYYSQ